MKKKGFNKRIILFVVCFLFIITGYFSSYSIKPIAGSFWRLVKGQYTVEEAKSTIDDALNLGLSYHKTLMDINGLKDNVIGTRIVKKGDSTVIKADSGKVMGSNGMIKKKDLEAVCEKTKQLKTVAEENGAKFLYCYAPSKEYYEKAPDNVKDYSKENTANFLKLLSDKEIPYLSFVETFEKNKMKDDDLYFVTDHHWKPYSGFVAAKAICEELSERYGFEYNRKYTDIKNYNIKKYEHWFLGSQGKKVGTWFTWNGADDFDLITPKFNTEFIEEQPAKKAIRTGRFEDTVLYMEKDYYNNSSYATYSGGDFKLQIMKNTQNKNGKKILMVRDSFACVVCPFLALQTNELHICDMRDMEGMIGEKLNLKEYIKKIKPDYVLILFNRPGDTSDDRYNFF